MLSQKSDIWSLSIEADNEKVNTTPPAWPGLWSGVLPYVRFQ